MMIGLNEKVYDYDYYLIWRVGGEDVERKVSLEDWCVAERRAGFRPKMSSDEPNYMTTPATGGFSGNGISGRIRPKE